MWKLGGNGASGFSYSSTAEQVTCGVDGTGLTAIITGASSGIGAETARVLSKRGVHVIMAGIDTDGSESVKDEIMKQIPSAKVDVMELDLSSMSSVRRFASKYISLGLPLNILINNAGIVMTPFKLSEDNVELQFATNHLGHFLLTQLLLDTMKKTAKESNIEGRIVIVSSEGHKLTYPEGIRFNDINTESGYNRIRAYCQSKLANVLHAKELARRLKEEGVNVTANSLHPGGVVTNVMHHYVFFNGLIKTLGRLVLKNVQQGAATTCYAALHPQVKGLSGAYFMDSNMAEPSDLAEDEELARKLWEFSLNLTDGSPSDQLENS